MLCFSILFFSFFTLQKFRLAAKMCVVWFKIVNHTEAQGAWWAKVQTLPLLGAAHSPAFAWKCPWTAAAARDSIWLTFQSTLFHSMAHTRGLNVLSRSTTHHSNVLTNRFCIGSSLLLPPLEAENSAEQPCESRLWSCYSDVMTGASHWGEPQNTVLLGSP